MKTKNLFLWTILLFGTMGFSSCEKNNGNENPHNNSGDSQIYGFDVGKVSDFDYMIANAANNNSVFFNVQGSSLSELYFKPYADDTYGYTMKFRSDGLPDLLIIGDTIVAFENYRDTKVDIAVIYPNITIKYHYGIDIGFNVNDLSQLKSTQSVLKFVSMGLSVASIVAAVVVPTPASPFIILAAATSLGISTWSVGNYFFEETIPAVPPSVEVFGAVLGCGVSLGWGCYTGALAATASVMADNMEYAESRAPLTNTAKAEMRDNNGSIYDPNNPNNPNDPNIPIIDKTVYVNLSSGEVFICSLKPNRIAYVGSFWGTWEQNGNTLRISWTMDNEWRCSYRLTGTINGNAYSGTFTHNDGATPYESGTFTGNIIQ